MSKLTQMRTLRVIAFLAAVVFLQALSPSSVLAGMQPDPECEQQCHDQYIFCLDYYCDPRGTCTCWSDYMNCVSYCPQVCVEPKSVRDYTNTVYVGIQVTSIEGCYRTNVTAVHNKVTYRERYDRYRETTHCNGTKTTELLSSSTSGTFACWKPINPLEPCSTQAIAFMCPF